MHMSDEIKHEYYLPLRFLLPCACGMSIFLPFKQIDVFTKFRQYALILECRSSINLFAD